jgi:hypothetical protein
MPIGYDILEELSCTLRNPLDPDWAIRGSPDPISTGYAARVQWQLGVRALSGTDDPVLYLMDTGDTREKAEAIVKNCLGTEGEE